MINCYIIGELATELSKKVEVQDAYIKTLNKKMK
ncbi:hypothetical protein HDC90_003431 [Pedobacter sp. AK013]|nr:hypothetical protein [Pedobacter sp. AK013]